MKIAIATLCFNEDWIIRACIENWKGKVFKHVVFHSDKPWHGIDLPHDKTQSICEEYDHVEFIRMKWRSEHEQRNWALAYLADYDYVLFVDADELYTLEDQMKILENVGKEERFQDNNWCYRVPEIVTFFKTPNYVLDPPDKHQPILAVNPKKILITEHRQPDTSFQIPLEGVKMYHATYLRPDDRLFAKLTQFEHYDQVKKNWFVEKWKNWTPEMEDVRSYGKEKSKAVPYECPQEIVDLLTGSV